MTDHLYVVQFPPIRKQEFIILCLPYSHIMLTVVNYYSYAVYGSHQALKLG